MGASSFKSSKSGSCTVPGTGGGCGTYAGNVTFTLSNIGIAATYRIAGGAATKAHILYSCAKVSFSALERTCQDKLIDSFQTARRKRSSRSIPNCARPRVPRLLRLHALFYRNLPQLPRWLLSPHAHQRNHLLRRIRSKHRPGTGRRNDDHRSRLATDQ